MRKDMFMEAAKQQRMIGKYRVIRGIGQGGEGEVYLAEDEDLHRPVAVKRVYGQREQEGQEETGGGILREAEILRQLCHPMLPVLYDLIREADVWYLVMEYIPGITLQESIGKNGPAGEKQAYAWAGQLLDILEYLHTRQPPVIYRDLKPQNIIVCPDGRLRMVDFGAAHRKDFAAGEGSRMAATRGYGAPEQFGDTGYGATADERSDIYAFGKVLYYMVTGADPMQPPYTALPVWDYQPVLGEGLERIIRRCIREEPAERYQMAETVRKELDSGEKRRSGRRRHSFIRVVEKKLWLTEGKPKAELLQGK